MGWGGGLEDVLSASCLAEWTDRISKAKRPLADQQGLKLSHTT